MLFALDFSNLDKTIGTMFDDNDYFVMEYGPISKIFFFNFEASEDEMMEKIKKIRKHCAIARINFSVKEQNGKFNPANKTKFLNEFPALKTVSSNYV